MTLLHLAQIATVATLWLVALAWSWKAVTTFLGIRHVPDLRAAAWDRPAPLGISLVAIVPACNEAASIERCVRSLLSQDLPGLHVLAVDDRSTDTTGAILDRLAAESPTRLTALHVRELPPGWLGKTHAMAYAAHHAETEHNPQWLLFTDGDIFFAEKALRLSVAAAETLRADHFITVPTPILKLRSEGLLMGYLQVFGTWAVRLWRVPDPRARDSFGIGAFNLIRASTYRALGGYGALRMEILDDLTLGRKVKQWGYRQQVAFGPGLVTVHWAAGAAGIIRTMTKNLFAVFGFRAPLVLLACLWLAALCLGPCFGLLLPITRLPSLLSLAAIFALYAVTGHYSGIPVLNVIGFPAASALFIYSLLRSTAVTLRRGGVEWRGTFYPLATLRERSSGPL